MSSRTALTHQQASWPRALQSLALLLLALTPLGCTSESEMALVDPAKYEFYSCAQLETAMKADRARALELQGLQRKAARSQTGAVIGNLTYGPEYRQTVGNMRVIAQTARTNNCSPPITVDPQFLGN